MDFSLGGGFAHVIDNVAEFPRDFAQDVIAGMRLACIVAVHVLYLRGIHKRPRTPGQQFIQSLLRCEMTILDRAYTCKEECPRRFTIHCCRI